MATFAINSNSDFHSLTSKAGNDTYNVNDVTLTLDADVRFGSNVSTSTGPFGDITISTALGGYAIGVNKTGRLTSSQSTMLLELYNIMGLDPLKPLIISPTERKVGTDNSFKQSIQNVNGVVTLTRIID